MLVYFEPRHAEPIVRFIQRAIVKDGMVPTSQEAEALGVLVKGIETEKKSVPYQIWQRNQAFAEAINEAIPPPAPAAPRVSVRGKKKWAGGRRGK